MGGAGNDTFIINQAMVTALQTPFGQPGNNGSHNAGVEGGEGGINTVNPGGRGSWIPCNCLAPVPYWT